MTQNKNLLTITLFCTPTDDGRTYVTSPHLEGFYFILEPGEDPQKELAETLRTFLSIYLQAKISKVRLSSRPKEFRLRALNVPATDIGQSEISMVAEAA